MANTYLSRSIDLIGLNKLAQALGVTYQAIRKWEAQGFLPRTEWTGETSYAQRIEELTDGKVSKDQLLRSRPRARTRSINDAVLIAQPEHTA